MWRIVLLVAGVGLAVSGVALVSVAAGLVVAGVSVSVFALMWDGDRE